MLPPIVSNRSIGAIHLKTCEWSKGVFYKPKKKLQSKNRIVDSTIESSPAGDSSDSEILLEDVSDSLKEIGTSFY